MITAALLCLGPIAGLFLAYNSPEEILPGSHIFHRATYSFLLLGEVLTLITLLGKGAIALLLPVVLLFALSKWKRALIFHVTFVWAGAAVTGDIILIALSLLGSMFSVCYLFKENVKDERIRSRKETYRIMRWYALPLFAGLLSSIFIHI